MRERERIATFFAPLTVGEPGSFHLTDDAALLTPPTGQSLVITTDSVIQNIHVLADASPAQYAQKLARRNLSDLAAMGATPWRYTLNLHTPPDLEDAWFGAFAAALHKEQTQFDMVLVGGDSTASDAPIHTTMTCFGLLQGAPLKRFGAQVGDDLYVSGTIGDAAAGLELLQKNPSEKSLLVTRYHVPQPRLALGTALLPIASAAMDISDGLMSDAMQLCAASGVGVTLQQTAIPISPELQQWLIADPRFWDKVFHGGDDYELCFTASPSHRTSIAALAQKLDLPLTRIGTITADAGVRLQDVAGTIIPSDAMGWEYR